MKVKQRFYLSAIILQIILVIGAILIANKLIGISAAQGSTVTSSYESITPGLLGIGAGIAIAGATIGAGMAIKTVGTAAIAALTENQSVFFKAFLVIAFGEALAIYGLIISILLLFKIPSP